ncbi:amidase [Halovulum dunhuangense]|uniref:Amidase n=1 Tax=Halovulum dunhuangense TaxID=1505036 RepID=A0A849L7F3_9RHOB|nr:amidase [Halovulum dunhuangense]NNU82030.1 amidase [Halovulum dunhuangense]
MIDPACRLSLTDLARRLDEGALSATQVTEAFLQSIDAQNDRLHAFISVDAENARRRADELDAMHARGARAGALHGVPVAVKDIIDVEGMATTGNSRITITEKAAEDAHVVARLRAAGAVIIGKTMLHEFATGGPSHDLPWPPARNPWNPAHHPAGSSSGSGAAVAASMSPAALGTDTAGSTRHPGTACGIVGMKPTYGAISRHGVFPLAFSLDHVGPMTRTVADNAALFDACIGHDPRDPTSLRDARPASPDLGKSVKGLRIGVLEEFNAHAEDEVRQSVEQALDTLREMGAELVAMDLPPLQTFTDCGRLIIQAESYAVHKSWMRSRAHEYGWRARTKILSGAFVDAGTYIQAQQLRRSLTQAFDQAMRGLDAAVGVSSLHLPARVDDDDAIDATYDRQARTPFNLTGSPAIAVPTGFAACGLPLGMQVVGHHRDEAMICRIGHQFEMARPWAHLFPPVADERADG